MLLLTGSSCRLRRWLLMLQLVLTCLVITSFYGNIDDVFEDFKIIDDRSSDILFLLPWTYIWYHNRTAGDLSRWQLTKTLPISDKIFCKDIPSSFTSPKNLEIELNQFVLWIVFVALLWFSHLFSLFVLLILLQILDWVLEFIMLQFSGKRFFHKISFQSFSGRPFLRMSPHRRTMSLT